MKALSVFTAILVFSFMVQAQTLSGLIDGNNSVSTSVAGAVAGIQAGSIVVIGENHGLKTHQTQQIQIMQALRDRGLIVAVGLEFLEYPFQADVNAFRRGLLTEDQFLKRVAWGSPSFDFYRDQALFSRLEEGSSTLALNIPRAVTTQIAKAGVNSLSADQQALMPPQFSLGRASYKERFLEDIPHLPNPGAGDNYFAAQSTWDDTMAWTATEYMKAHANQVLVIVVGEFHVQYGGGLPDRLRARGNFPVLTFSQVQTEGMDPSEVEAATKPSEIYGPRADFIWLQ